MSKMSELSIHLQEQLTEVENIILELSNERDSNYARLWEIDDQLREARFVKDKLLAIKASFTST